MRWTGCEATWRFEQAQEIERRLLCRLIVRLRIDLDNIRTMLRLKMAEREEETPFFLPGGFVDMDKFEQGLEAGLRSDCGSCFMRRRIMNCWKRRFLIFAVKNRF